jgi:hypothetical protein
VVADIEQDDADVVQHQPKERGLATSNLSNGDIAHAARSQTVQWALPRIPALQLCKSSHTSQCQQSALPVAQLRIWPPQHCGARGSCTGAHSSSCAA